MRRETQYNYTPHSNIQHNSKRAALNIMIHRIMLNASMLTVIQDQCHS